MKHIKHLIITTLLLSNVTIAQQPDSILGNPSSNVRADDIPAGSTGYNYVDGAAMAKDSIPVPTYSRTYKVDTRIHANRYRSCGELPTFKFKDMFDSIKDEITREINEMIGVAQQLPVLIVASVVEYAMAKINPTLKQLYTEYLDGYFELFELNVKACEDVRADLAKNPNASIFDGLFKVAVADQWEYTIGTGGFRNTEEEKARIEKEAKKRGVVMADGKRYGGQDNEPINFVKSLAETGINLIAGRQQDQGNTTFNVAERKEKPITGVFEKPQELIEFLEDIYGSVEFKIAAAGTADAVKSKAGVGYFLRYTENRAKIYEKLKQYVNQSISRQAFIDETGVLIPPAVIDDIRQTDTYGRQVEIERMAKKYAIDDLQRKLIFARSALSAGITSPDMQQSQVSGFSEKAYKKLYFAIQDDLAELDSLKY